MPNEGELLGSWSNFFRATHQACVHIEAVNNEVGSRASSVEAELALKSPVPMLGHHVLR